MRAPSAPFVIRGRTAQQGPPFAKSARQGMFSHLQDSSSVHLVMLGSMTMIQRRVLAAQQVKCRQQLVRMCVTPVVRAHLMTAQNCVRTVQQARYSHQRASHRASSAAQGNTMISPRSVRSAQKAKCSHHLARHHAPHVEQASSMMDPKNARSAVQVASNCTQARHPARIAQLAFSTMAAKCALRVLLVSLSHLLDRRHATPPHAQVTRVGRASLLAAIAMMDSSDSSLCHLQPRSTTESATSANRAGQTRTATARQTARRATPGTLQVLAPRRALLVLPEPPTRMRTLPRHAQTALLDSMRVRAPRRVCIAPLDIMTMTTILLLRVTATKAAVR